MLKRLGKYDDIIGRISNSVESVSGMTQSIADATRLQSETSGQISMRIEGMSVVTNNLKKSVQTIEAQASNLLSSASILDQKVRWFQTNGQIKGERQNPIIK